MSQKREQLLQTGEALFVKHGMRRVTVEESCRRAGIRPEFLLAAFEALNSLQHEPRIRDLYPNAGTLAGDVFTLFYYGALAAEHRQDGSG